MGAFDTARDIRDRHRDEIMALPEVVGCGIGANADGEAVIRLYLRTDQCLRSYADLIPHIEGVPTEWHVTGDLVAAAHA